LVSLARFSFPLLFRRYYERVVLSIKIVSSRSKPYVRLQPTPMPTNKAMITRRTQDTADSPRVMVVIDCEIAALFFWSLAAHRAAPTLILEDTIVVFEAQAIRAPKIRVPTFTAIGLAHESSL
jgi:hypothetical protein